MMKQQCKQINDDLTTFAHSKKRNTLCIIGLGNPGHDKSRHNAGFHFVDELARLLSVSLKKKLFSSYLYADLPEQSLINSREISTLSSNTKSNSSLFNRMILIKPLTYMNRAGTVIPDILRTFENSSTAIQFIIAADNIDLPIGTARLKRYGGSAGNKGLKSVMEYLNKDFWPLYLGVGHPSRDTDLAFHVLEPLSKYKQELLFTHMAQWAKYLLCLFSDDLDQVMQLINSFT